MKALKKDDFPKISRVMAERLGIVILGYGDGINGGLELVWTLRGSELTTEIIDSCCIGSIESRQIISVIVAVGHLHDPMPNYLKYGYILICPSIY